MRRCFIVVFLTMLLDSFTHAQEIERDYYDSGHLKFEGIYVENEDDIIANYRSYFKTADLETRLVTVPGKQGLQNFTIVDYVAPGLLSTKHTMANGKLVGDFVFNDYFENGELQTRIKGSSTLPQLTYKEYYSNRKIKAESTIEFNNEVKQLDYIMRDASDFTEEYIQQNTSGTLVSYHPNGNVAYKGAVVDGEEDGEILYLTPNNDIIKKYTIKNGEESGPGEVNTFYSNGQLKTHTETYNGLKSGLYVRFYEDSQIAERGYYSQEDFDGNGLEIFKKGIWRNYEYHSNGNLAEEVTYVNQLKSGKYQKLDEHGRILEAGKYLAGEMHGVWQLYDEEQERTLYAKYDNGELLGAASNLFNTIKVKNTCYETIYVLIFIDDDWQIKGWVSIPPNSTRKVLETKADTFYFYAKSNTYNWGGSVERLFQDEEYGFSKMSLEKEFYKGYTQVLNCNE